MCTACEQLIIAIDAYIRKADEKLSDTLGKEGFAEPEDTVRHIEQLEEELENIFGEQTDEFRKMLKKAMEQSAECEEKLTALLEDKEKTLLLRLINAENEIGSTMALENFILGFRLGVRMILEALDEDDGSLLDPNKEE